jgi:hypothetical protein
MLLSTTFRRARAALLSGCLLAPAAHAQTPSLTWSQLSAAGQSVGPVSGNNAYTAAVATDASGNVYLAGTYTGTVTFGPYVLTSAAYGSVFAAKWNPASQTYAWAERLGDNASVVSMTVSGTSLYLSGTFLTPTATLGSTVLTNANPVYNPNTASDAFVLKVSDLGQSAATGWVQQISSTGDDQAPAIVANGSSVYVAGSFTGPVATLGSFSLAKSDPTHGSNDAFVAKLTDEGNTANFTWAQQMGGTRGDASQCLAVSGANVYVSGITNSPTAVFGNLSFSNNYFYNVFIAKLVDAGPSSSFAWVQQGGSPDNNTYGQSLAVQGTSVYLAGSFYASTCTFGPTTLANANNAGNTTSDVYLTKLTDAGNTATFSWAQQGGGTGGDQPTAVLVNGNAVYLVGNSASTTATFGPLTLVNFGNNGYPDIFVSKLLDVGWAPQWAEAKTAGGIGNDQTSSATLAGNQLFVAGFISTPAYFGTLSYVYPAASSVPFLATLTDGTGLATTNNAPLQALTVAPNPARHTVAVQVPAVPGATEVALALIDSLGRPVRQLRLPLPATGTSIGLDLAGLAPGLYRLQVQSGSQRLSRALAVE